MKWEIGFMNRSEIYLEYKRIVQELKFLQSLGLYNKEKIEKLQLEKEELQNKCPHLEKEMIKVDEEVIYICKDCKKIIY